MARPRFREPSRSRPASRTSSAPSLDVSLSKRPSSGQGYSKGRSSIRVRELGESKIKPGLSTATMNVVEPGFASIPPSSPNDEASYLPTDSGLLPATDDLKTDTEEIGVISGLAFDWVRKYEPESVEDLAMHRTKIDELNRAMHSDQIKVLIVSGPAGSAKSSAARVLAAEAGKRILEYSAPDSGGVDSFEDFLSGAAMYDPRSVVILVDETPNLFYEPTRASFETALLDWVMLPGVPLIILTLTELEVSAKYSESLVVPRIVESLLQPPLVSHTAWVKTNPVNAGLLGAALRRIAKFEHLSVPKPVLSALSSGGDVRSSVNALQLWSHNQTGSIPLTRGAPTQLFYAIGKVVWGSSKPGSTDAAIDIFDESIGTFNLTILENYASAKHQRLPLETAVISSEWLSEADMALRNDAESSITTLGARGVAIAIGSSAPDESLPKKFNPMKFTQYPRWRREELDSMARLGAFVRNRRAVTPVTRLSAVLDEQPYSKQVHASATVDTNFSSDDDF